MTKDKFLKLLAATPRDWFIDIFRSGHGAIRRKDFPRGDQCPISSLCDFQTDEYVVAAKELGLPDNLTYTIIQAADGWEGCDPEMRQALMEACGLGVLVGEPR